jgi:hypothetical protein
MLIFLRLTQFYEIIYDPLYCTGDLYCGCVTSTLCCYKGCSESNAPHFFSQKLFIQNVRNSLTVQLDISFTHVIFPHNIHLRLWPYASAKQGRACLPCTSSFPVPVRVAMSMNTWLCEQEMSWYREGMHALVSRWRKAIDVDGYYVEK